MPKLACRSSINQIHLNWVGRFICLRVDAHIINKPTGYVSFMFAGTQSLLVCVPNPKLGRVIVLAVHPPCIPGSLLADERKVRISLSGFSKNTQLKTMGWPTYTVGSCRGVNISSLRCEAAVQQSDRLVLGADADLADAEGLTF